MPAPTERTSRRTFLAASTAAIAAPLFLGASNKSGSGKPIVGEGEHTYECDHFWGHDALPDGAGYGGASHGVAVDGEGLIYITHTGSPGSVFVFSPNGKFVKSMGDLHAIKSKASSRSSGHGIDIRTEGSEQFIYLSPANPSLFFTKMTLDGEVVWNRGRAELTKDSGVYDNPKAPYRPTNASFRPDGGYYLGDGYGSNVLFEYDADDKFVRTIGGTGSEAGQFKTPHGQWLDTRGEQPMLVVADRANARLQWFDLDGGHVRTQDGFLFPADIDLQGDILLVPDLHARITLLDKNNEVITHLGDDEQWRSQVLDKNIGMRGKRDLWQAGRFVHPHDACFDADGNIFVAEWVVGGRVTKLTKVG